MIIINKTVTPLAAFASWNGGWFGNAELQVQGLQPQAEVLASVSVFSDQAGSIQIIQSDDPTNPNMTIPSGDSKVVTPNAVVVLQVPITHLYFQAVLTNGAKAQTVVEAVVSCSSSIQLAILQEIRKLRFDMQARTAKDDADSQPVGTL